MTANNDANLSTLIQRVESLSDAANDLFNAVREAAPPEAAAINAAVNNHNNDEQAHAGLFRNVESVRKRFTDFQTNFYLSPNGVDADVVPDTPDKAWKTLAWAMRWTSENADLCGNQLWLNLAPGNYAAKQLGHGDGSIHSKLFPNCGHIRIRGSEPNNKAVLTGKCAFVNYMRVFVENIIFRGSLVVSTSSYAYLINCDFEYVPSDPIWFALIRAQRESYIDIDARSCFVRGNWNGASGGALEAAENSELRWSVGSCDMSGFSTLDNDAAFALATLGGTVLAGSHVYGQTTFLNASNVRLRKFYVDANGLVHSGWQGINIFPGNKAGIAETSRGGLYI